MAGLIKVRIQAGALLEVLVAISILVTVFAVGTMIYLKVSSSTYTGEMIKADLFLNKVSEETIKARSYFDEELEMENVIIKKTVEKYNGTSNLLLIKLTAYNKLQRVLSRKKQIVLIDELQN